MQLEFKEKALAQLKQARGMLEKVTAMVENGDYCIDILQQSLATIGFLRSTNKIITANHLSSCFREGMTGTDKKKQQELVDELLHILHKS